MWHEARRQERKIRGMLVDYQRRAERRRDFYETIKADPTQFLQLHGRRCKIHLDPAIAAAGDSPANMMPWQNNLDNMIDRFDVRAHLDYIPDVLPASNEEISSEQRQCNYESYRILAQNAFLGVKEEKFLQQLAFEEQFGTTPEETLNKKKSKSSSSACAAIGYNYDTAEVIPAKFDKSSISRSELEQNSDSSDSELEIDMDVSIDITKVGLPQAHEMNTCAQAFGMADNDFYSFLTRDADEAESLRIAREEEQEKAMFSGRKSRRERRQHKERKLQDHHFTSFSFALDKSPTETVPIEKSPSRSPSPNEVGQITYITSFGDEEENAKTPNKALKANSSLGGTPVKNLGMKVSPSSKRKTYADKLKQNLDLNDSGRKKSGRSRSRSRSRSRTRYRRSRSHSPPRAYRHRSPSYRRRRSRSRSRSRYDRRHGSWYYSRSTNSHSRRSPSPRSHRSRSPRRHRSKSPRYNRSRSPRPTIVQSPKHVVQGPMPRLTISSPNASKSPRPDRSKSPKLRISKSNSSDSSSSSKSSHGSLALLKNNQSSMDDLICVSKDNNNSGVNVTAGAPPLKKYYGRKRGNESSSELSVSNSEDSDVEMKDAPENTTGNSIPVESCSISSSPALQYSGGIVASNSSTNSNTATNSTTFGKTKANTVSKAASKQSTSGGGILNIQDRLKRKMQAQLAKTLKADKKAENERNERVMQQQLERDEEMREMAIKIRRRQRAIRHRYNSDQSSNSSDDDSKSKSKSKSRSCSPERPKSKNRSQSKSPSPIRQKPIKPQYSEVAAKSINSELKNEDRNYSSRSSYREDRPRSNPDDRKYRESSRRKYEDYEDRDSRDRKTKPLVDY